MKFIYSQLASDSVLDLVKSNYELIGQISSKFYVLGLHDNYLIECNKIKYIFRVYRNNWRTEEEILFEVELLSYLEKTSGNVAAPVRTKNNKLTTHFETPEGARIGVLFNYADGCPPASDISCKECNLLGISVANIHDSTNNYKSKFKREILDLPYLVDQSLTSIKSFLNSRQIEYLSHIREVLYDNISSLTPDNSDFGICTGDINNTNFHINTKQRITHFDFDQCGYGFRAFEIGKYTLNPQNCEVKRDKVRSFIDGYESVRSISKVDKMAIPYFEIAAVIWVMSIHALNVDKIGYQYLDENFWKKRIGSIESLEKNLV